MNLIDTFKDKLKNLVVPEASADPGPGEVEETEQAVTVQAENARSKVQAKKAGLIETEKAVVRNSEQKEAEHEEETSEKDVISEKESILIDKSENDFNCEICDFTSNWKNRLEIHMIRKHSSVEQLDGNVTFDDDMDEEF